MTMQGGPLGGSQPPRRVVTVLESVTELRDQIRQAQTVKEAALTPRSPTQAQPQAQPDADTQAFRPSHRPPTALLTVLDDGDDSGETIRIRGDRFVIGRADGDLIVPHDGAISGRHAEIVRRLENGQFNWYLRDLQSSNGTFVRVSRTLLAPDQEILLGSRRYRLESTAPAGGTEPALPANATRKWHVGSLTETDPVATSALVELAIQGEAKRFPLSDSEHWIGRDARQCSIVIDDRMLSPRHARLHRDTRGRWHIENAQSLNGLWFRISELALDRGGHFQCGEQRFMLKIM